jgi:biotin synthase-like enzyme
MKRHFTSLRRITAYARPDNISLYSDDELSQCRELGLSIVYIGLESGSDRVLRLAGKGSHASDFITACNRLSQAGIKVSATAVLGLGGKEFTNEHAIETAHAVNEAKPSFFSLLNLIKGNNEAFLNRIQPLSRLEVLDETITIVDSIRARCVFRANHPSNLVDLEGRLPRDAQRLIEELRSWGEILTARGLGDSVPVNDGETGY